MVVNALTAKQKQNKKQITLLWRYSRVAFISVTAVAAVDEKRVDGNIALISSDSETTTNPFDDEERGEGW